MIQGLLTEPLPDAKILPLFPREALLLSEALRTVPRLFTPADFLGTTLTSASPAFAGVGRKTENPRRNESPSAKTKSLPARTAKNLLSPSSNVRHPFPKIPKIFVVRQGKSLIRTVCTGIAPSSDEVPRSPPGTFFYSIPYRPKCGTKNSFVLCFQHDDMARHGKNHPGHNLLRAPMT